LEKEKVIRPYVPVFGSSRASAFLHILSRNNAVRRNSGLYKLGHGEKSIIWYWEFDMEKRYFHQFKTIDYAAAVGFYKANKFTMWWWEGIDADDFDIDSVPPKHKKEGTDWYAIFNPRATRQLEISLVHTLMHERYLILSRNSQYSDARIPSPVLCVRFSTDGKYLATGCKRTVQIYDANTGQKTWLAVSYTLVIASAHREVFQCTRRRYRRGSR